MLHTAALSQSDPFYTPLFFPLSMACNIIFHSVHITALLQVTCSQNIITAFLTELSVSERAVKRTSVLLSLVSKCNTDRVNLINFTVASD